MNQSNFNVKTETVSDKNSKFIISPLPRGFGQSLGNALRRTLLTSIEGLAVTYVKINEEVHPFGTIVGIKDSVLEMMLNCKKLRFSAKGEGPFKLNLKKTGKKGELVKVYGSDFNGSCDVVNGDLLIAELSDESAKLEIELIVEKGVGYQSKEEKENKGYGILAVESVFSPVLRVSYLVEDERVGRSSNFDRLTLDVVTDGSISASGAFTHAIDRLRNIFNNIDMDSNPIAVDGEKSFAAPKKKVKADKALETIIDELDLPTRVINALLREGIETVGDLLKKGKEELVNMKGVGRKSVDLIEKELTKLNISLE